MICINFLLDSRKQRRKIAEGERERENQMREQRDLDERQKKLKYQIKNYKIV